MVRDAHLAEDVTQGAFMALAQNARQLTDRPVLSGWLHVTAQNLATKVVRSDVRRRAREQEAAAMNELLATEPEAVWEHIAPQLDAALGELNEPDRDALLLRYFERKSAREMSQILGVSEDAAQKRVSRAVERLREFFAKRGIAVGASGLVVVISANAVQAAPVGLAATISTAAALAGTTIATTATATATKAIAMTALQKTLIGSALVVAIGTGVYELRHASQLREKNHRLERQQAPLVEQIRLLAQAFKDATNQIAALREDNERLNRNSTELLRLRGEVARLRRDSEELARLKAHDAKDPSVAFLNTRLSRVELLKERLQQTPAANIPELQSLTEDDWLNAVKEELKTDADFRKALSRLRNSVEGRYAYQIEVAAKAFSQAQGGQMPTDLSELKPYFKTPIADAILGRYEIVPADSLPTITLPGVGDWVVTQKAAVDLEYDTRFAVATVGGSGYTGSGSFAESEMVRSLMPAIKAYFAAKGQGTLNDLAQLSAYADTPDAQAALEKARKWYEEQSPKSRADSLKRLDRFRQK